MVLRWSHFITQVSFPEDNYHPGNHTWIFTKRNISLLKMSGYRYSDDNYLPGNNNNDNYHPGMVTRMLIIIQVTIPGNKLFAGIGTRKSLRKNLISWISPRKRKYFGGITIGPRYFWFMKIQSSKISCYLGTVPLSTVPYLIFIR